MSVVGSHQLQHMLRLKNRSISVSDTTEGSAVMQLNLVGKSLLVTRQTTGAKMN
jgi:hypothetical protein